MSRTHAGATHSSLLRSISRVFDASEACEFSILLGHAQAALKRGCRALVRNQAMACNTSRFSGNAGRQTFCRDCRLLSAIDPI